MRHLLALSFILLMSSIQLFAQTQKIKITDTNLHNSYQIYHVLKSDNSVKEGGYKYIIKGSVAVEGEYHLNHRTGVWKWLDEGKNIENMINYDSRSITYRVFNKQSKIFETFTDHLIPDGNREAILLTSDREKNLYLNRLLNYPNLAREGNISGTVEISVGIDSTGKIISYTNDNNANDILYQEALRVMRLIPLEFLPAYKDGHPVSSAYKTPVHFALQ